MSDTTLSPTDIHRITASLNAARVGAGASALEGLTDAQPVHTVYGGAHLFVPDLPRKLGALALKSLETHAPTADDLARALELPAALTARIYPRLIEKLTREPVEDLRIDFEDGFGNRPADEEDHYARQSATHVGTALEAGSLPHSVGVRIKPLSHELAARSLRTLDLFLTRLVDRTGGRLPPRLLVTLPKIVSPAEVSALAAACDAFERTAGVASRTLRIELMIETPQAIVAPDGSIALPRLVAAGDGRVTGTHFGTYDYTASLGITAAHQHMTHPACDFARHVMQVALADTPVRVSDGATNILPIPPHRAAAGAALSAVERQENEEAVHRAWRLHARHIRRALVEGIYQGWDLHPAQLPARYAAVYAFFLEGLDGASERLRNFVARAAQATLVGDVFDDAATGQGLLNYFLRALNCGAITESDAVEQSGLSLAELRSRSFLAILEHRRGERPLA